MVGGRPPSVPSPSGISQDGSWLPSERARKGAQDASHSLFVTYSQSEPLSLWLCSIQKKQVSKSSPDQTERIREDCECQKAEPLGSQFGSYLPHESVFKNSYIITSEIGIVFYLAFMAIYQKVMRDIKGEKARGWKLTSWQIPATGACMIPNLHKKIERRVPITTIFK